MTRFVRLLLCSFAKKRARPKSASFKVPLLSIRRFAPRITNRYKIISPCTSEVSANNREKLLHWDLLYHDAVLCLHDNNGVPSKAVSYSTGSWNLKNQALVSCYQNWII